MTQDATQTQDNEVRVFCGADRTQLLAYKVLEHSIKRHSSLPVTMQRIDNSLAPEPKDPRYSSYTGFSFSRFAIPSLCGYKGKAIWMDSDMLVFQDIKELWETPLGTAQVAIEIGSRNQEDAGKHTAVMLMDCAQLNWNVNDLIAGLGEKYTYDELLGIEKIIGPNGMQELLPTGWNDLDVYNADRTRNIHYTIVLTQPWVYAGHKFGYLWLDEIKLMLQDGSITEAFLREEVKLGYLRPSILLELGFEKDPSVDITDGQSLRDYDKVKGYIKHKHFQDASFKRTKAIKKYEADLAMQESIFKGIRKKLSYLFKYALKQ